MAGFPVALAVLLVATRASGAPAKDQVIYAPVPGWVLPPPVSSGGPPSADAPLQVIYSDQQVRIGPSGQENYAAYRVRILQPEALQFGNVAVGWSPSSGTATVHALRIIRDGQPIDLLKSQRFQVLQRERGLEQSILDGQLTATLQAAGLRVGDEMEFSATVLQRDPTLGDRSFGRAQLTTQGSRGAFRFRLSWPEGTKLTWRASRDLPQAVPVTANGRTAISYQLDEPLGVITNDGAPGRYNIRRLVEYSDYSSWREVSARILPLFEAAAALKPGSPVRAQAAAIAAESVDPVNRAQLALRLVQDQVRYVYIGLDGGNLRPAATDETWQRRFGDCKAKTVLLLTLLRELGIAAEAVLVNAAEDDGLDARLPSPGAFNHVLVRARIGTNSYWLDGTRSGDRFLDRIPAPRFRWALPLRAAGSELEPVLPVALTRPQTVEVVKIDASAGYEAPAKVVAEDVLRQDEAFAIRTQLLALPKAEADRAVRSYWRRRMAWVDPDQVEWRYDERNAVLVLSLRGEGKLDWEGAPADGRSLDIPNAGFYPPDLRRRPKEQDRTAPWTVEFPRFRCSATTIRLPAADAKRHWALYADPMNGRLGGTAYWRASGLDGTLVQVVTSTRAEKPEITASEANATNDAIPGFNNNISRVYQIAGASGARSTTPRPPLPFKDTEDWTGDAPRCSSAPNG